MKRKLIYLFIAFAAAILPAHAQKFLNDELTLSNVSLWQQGNSLYVGMTFDMSKLTIGSTRSLSLIPLLTDGQHNVPLQEIIVNGKRREKAYIRGLAITKQEPTALIVPYNKPLVPMSYCNYQSSCSLFRLYCFSLPTPN